MTPTFFIANMWLLIVLLFGLTAILIFGFVRTLVRLARGWVPEAPEEEEEGKAKQ